MARYYTALGPFDSRETAERARVGMTESDALRASALRLRDRTGPSVAARLAHMEDMVTAYRAAATASCNTVASESGDLAARLAHMETEHAALAVRVGELERLPVAGEAEPAPVRPEPGSVAEDPDRLAKVAEPTDDALLDLFERSEYAGNDTRAARRALYNLGREHGQQVTGAIAAGSIAMAAKWRMAKDRAALLARAENAERDFAALHADSARVVGQLEAELATLRTIQPTAHVPDGETRDPSREQMAAELREAGWWRGADGAWAFASPERSHVRRTTKAAHAAMRAAKGAR